jgi:hypothetical protein
LAISAVDVIGPAFDRMKQQLFRPFRFGQWLRLAVVGLLSGEMGSAGGCNFRFPFNTTNRGQHFQIPAVPGFPGIIGILFLGFLALAGIALMIALLYVSSRMRFVLFDSVVEGQCRIGEFWSRRGGPAFRFFVWQLVFLLLVLLGFIVVLGIPLAFAQGAGWLSQPRQHLVPLVLVGILVVLAFLAMVVLIAVVYVLTKDFVVPQMALDDVTATEGWRRLWAMMQQEQWGYAGYIGMKFVLAIGAAVFLGIITLIALIVLLIPVGGLGALAAIWARQGGISWNPVTIALAIIAGMVLVSGLLFIVGMISVPAIVFFPAYSIHFFADRYPPLSAALANPPAP